jgi:hypothetical protein
MQYPPASVLLLASVPSSLAFSIQPVHLAGGRFVGTAHPVHGQGGTAWSRIMPPESMLPAPRANPPNAEAPPGISMVLVRDGEGIPLRKGRRLPRWISALCNAVVDLPLELVCLGWARATSAANRFSSKGSKHPPSALREPLFVQTWLSPGRTQYHRSSEIRFVFTPRPIAVGGPHYSSRPRYMTSPWDYKVSERRSDAEMLR